MRAHLDLAGSLKYFFLRLTPFVQQAWARHSASGLKFRVYLRDVVGRTILRRHAYEPQLTEWLLARFERGAAGIFIDVGANIGWFSLQAARSPQVPRVIAIEPDVGNHQLLRTNVQANGLGDRIDAVACAAGAGNGLARLHQYKASNLGRHSLLADHGHGSSWVPVESVDGLLEQLDLGDAPIAAIKIDVEGYEPAVLSGAQQALQRAQVLLVELSPAMSRDGGLDLPAMLDAIAEEGFVPDIWDQSGAVPDFAGLREHAGQVTVGFCRKDG